MKNGRLKRPEKIDSIFECRILRKIFSPVEENPVWWTIHTC
jgi:hypothetical protein